jgi:hypothetical protein
LYHFSSIALRHFALIAASIPSDLTRSSVLPELPVDLETIVGMELVGQSLGFTDLHVRAVQVALLGLKLGR